MKKSIFAALTIIMLSLSFSILAFAADSLQEGDYTYARNSRGVTLLKYTGTAESIEVPSTLGRYPVTEIEGNAFNDHPTLQSISIPDGIQDFPIDWYEYFIDSSLDVTTIKISADAPWVRWDSFGYCKSLTSIIVDPGNELYSSDENGLFYNKDKTQLIRCPRGKTGVIELSDTVQDIGERAFSGCAEITSVGIPEGVTSIQEWAFSSCDSLTTVALPSTLKTIGWSAFRRSNGLRTITIPDGVTTLAMQTFANCENLESVILPDGLTYIADGLFWGCTSLTSIELPDSVERIKPNAFEGCTALTEIQWPKNLKRINRAAFAICTGLTVVDIPDGVEEIGTSAFERCENLTEITIPDSVTLIKSYALSNCPKLTTIYGLPDTAAQEAAKEYGVNFVSLLVEVQINGNKMHFDVPPRIKYGKAMVPMRAIFEELGAEVTWDDTTKTVTATKDDLLVTLQIDNPILTVNGENIPLDVAPYIAGSRTLVPLRAIAESLHTDVQWDEGTKTVLITA